MFITGRSRLSASVLMAALFLLLVSGTATATSYPNSLWIGTDNFTNLTVLNTDTSGNILRSVPTTEATGFAIDLTGNIVYFGTSTATITPRNLDTLVAGTSITPPTGFSEDMTFDGSHIWRARIALNSQFDPMIFEIDPANGQIVSSFNPGGKPMGIAWDGSGLWVSQFESGLVQRFDTSGNPTGQSFNPNFGSAVGGLGFDPRDGTLWIGTWDGVYHYETDGTQLGFFDVSLDSPRFIDGLEFQAAPVPIPPSLLLLGSGLLGLGAAGWRRRKMD
jgi:YD repeat-containing protein